MKKCFIAAILGSLLFQVAGLAAAPQKNSTSAATRAGFHALSAEEITGKLIPFSEFKGKVVMVVNTASQCGYTSQYKGLEALYRKYKDKGFVVLGFPSNDFGGQEPGSNAEVKKFCELRYKVTFPMFAKVNITSQPRSAVYEYLLNQNPNPDTRKTPSWNFWKYVIDKKGQVVSAFASSTEPESLELDKLIGRLLAEK
ncbi:MAG: hypothetical protein RLZZ488_1333 [Pseudomonadota bacterium]|jgi:glutathione peroxidase